MGSQSKAFLPISRFDFSSFERDFFGMTAMINCLKIGYDKMNNFDWD